MAVSAKIKNLAPGAYFNAGPVEVVVLEHFTDGRTLLAAKEPIGNRPFTVRPFTYNRMEPEPAANNFAFSTLRFDLNEDFLSALDDAGVIPANKVLEAEWSLADHDGTNRYGVAVCKVAESLGTVLDPDFFGQAEQYARRKLDMCNERAGRIYGEDGYGDEYLVLLTADTVREMAFSAWCEIRNAEITAAREKAVGA